MSELTGGELLARALANEGVKFVFGLPCPEIDPLLAALDANGIRLVTIRHEAAAVHMAEGLYKTTGKVASKGVIHKKQAQRRISRLMKAVAAIAK